MVKIGLRAWCPVCQSHYNTACGTFQVRQVHRELREQQVRPVIPVTRDFQVFVDRLESKVR